MTTRQYLTNGYDGPLGTPSVRPIISSIRVEETPSHWRIHVWNRGGKAGVLTVDADCGQAIVDRLLPPHTRELYNGPS